MLSARILSILSIILSSLAAAGQSHYRVINWNVEKGLTQSTVYSILGDKYGFIWFTSEDGLNRFDGNYFRTFQSSLQKNTENIIGIETVGLVEDSLNNVWIGSDEV